MFHFWTNHEAAERWTGSGTFRHVQLNCSFPRTTAFLMLIFYRVTISLTGPDVQKKMYQMEIQLGNMVAHFFGTFPFTQTELAENQSEDRLTPPSQHSQNTRLRLHNFSEFSIVAGAVGNLEQLDWAYF